MHAGGASAQGPADPRPAGCSRPAMRKLGDKKRRSVSHLTVKGRCRWQARMRARLIPRGGPMQMHQVRYFLALCEERNFTRAARRCGISQPSLTAAIMRLEQALGSALFKRKPAVALTVLGHAVHPYLQRIVENAELARNAAQALANARQADQGA